jgi:hypothetical protein
MPRVAGVAGSPSLQPESRPSQAATTACRDEQPGRPPPLQFTHAPSAVVVWLSGFLFCSHQAQGKPSVAGEVVLCVVVQF